MTAAARRRFLRQAALATAAPWPLAALAAPQFAQGRLIVGFPAGDPVDIACRSFGERMRDSYATTLIVDNRAGAGGRIGVQEMRNAATDGSAMLLTPASMLALYPHVYKTLPYDPFKDLMPVSRAATFTFCLSVGPMVPATVTDLGGFLAWCRDHPSQANFASPGTGASPHFLGSLLARAAKVELNHVPYKGGSPAVSDMVAGQVASAVTSPAAVLPHVKSGRARMLAVTSPTRWSLVPDVPTMTEAGFPQVTATEWFGFFMRGGAPAAAANRASEAIRAAAAAIEQNGVLAQFAMQAHGSTPAELGELLARDHAHWQSVVKSFGFTPQD
ncbi:MAG: tripartite tricarboxylate transporter substrate-binding protein [Lautropia sp.]